MVPESGLHEATVDLLRDGLMARYLDAPDVAVFCRLGWFPDRGDTRIRLDPDLMVVFGRPPGHRKSYRTWAEDDVAPTILVEVRSEDDTDADYRRRLGRARAYGVEEVLLIAPYTAGGVIVEHLGMDPGDPTRFRVLALSGSGDHPVQVARLGLTLAGGPALVVVDEHGPWPDGTRTFIDARRADTEAARADAEADRADAEAARADTEAARAEALAGRVAELEARLGERPDPQRPTDPR